MWIHFGWGCIDERWSCHDHILTLRRSDCAPNVLKTHMEITFVESIVCVIMVQLCCQVIACSSLSSLVICCYLLLLMEYCTSETAAANFPACWIRRRRSLFQNHYRVTYCSLFSVESHVACANNCVYGVNLRWFIAVVSNVPFLLQSLLKLYTKKLFATVF